MEHVKKWASTHKKACLLTGLTGLLLAPFLWPLFLAAILQSITLGLPIAAGIYFYQYLKKENTNENEHACRNPQTDAAASGEIHKDAEVPHAVPEDADETPSEPVNAHGDRADNLEQTAALWYEKEGKERLCAICKKAAQEGKNSISIGKEGICTIPSKGSYQRIGFLKGFPKGQQESLIQVFKRDGFLVRTSGNYLRLYWKRGEFQ